MGKHNAMTVELTAEDVYLINRTLNLALEELIDEKDYSTSQRLQYLMETKFNTPL